MMIISVGVDMITGLLVNMIIGLLNGTLKAL